VEKALDTRTQMSVLGDMQRYQQFQLGQAIGAPGGGGVRSGLGEGVGLGAGLALGQQLAQGAVAAPAAASPPPLPGLGAAAPVFHVSQNGQSQGPFALPQLQAAIAQGQLNAATLVWSPGMSGWLPAGQVPSLAAYLAPPPPPPPVPR
jgi:membrane protease subunit (stomatin/prohibitin family)